MHYFVSKPSVALSQYVKGYWGMSSRGSFKEPYNYRIVPSGIPELTFYFGHRPAATDKSFALEENTLICGHKKQYQDIVISDELEMFSVLFQPQGLMAFFDIPLAEFYNRMMPLKYILRGDSDELEMRLNEAESFGERIVLIERFLLKRLEKSRKKYEYNRVNHSIGLINNSKASVSIEQLASHACLSRKQLERVFSDYIGSTPKQFLKTVRFQSALAQKSLFKEKNLTELAYDAGYYDQSHMINDFKILSGFTPGEFFAECEPTSDYFLF
ncbi:AraC family transcriptional regulator [Paludibacter sp. 221]|uniref:helix-turn-helix domain-containing protein n=1 Tax=Paludibacter sp. 221 TaxID=2302939 RepID=UPI0013D6C03D|nr:helix-turn-helix domain-containing protein [Paludibacter sp. 221]NDV46338.1 AraC family transcriptional regulator [Paludibacter sp. 221]